MPDRHLTHLVGAAKGVILIVARVDRDDRAVRHHSATAGPSATWWATRKRARCGPGAAGTGTARASDAPTMQGTPGAWSG